MDNDTEFLLDQETKEIPKRVRFGETVSVYSDYVCPLMIDEFDSFIPKGILLPSKFSMRTNMEGENTLSCLGIVLLLLFLSLLVIVIIIIMQKLLFIEIDSSINPNNSNNLI